MKMRGHSFLFAIAVLAFGPACSRSNGSEAESAAAVVTTEEPATPEACGTDRAYVVADGYAGPFRIGAGIPKNPEGFEVTLSHEEMVLPTGETRDIPVYIYEIGNEGWVKVKPRYDAAADCFVDTVGEIYAYSDLFQTAEGIGAMSSLEEYAAEYPDYRIRRDGDTGLSVAETPRLGNVQFVLDDESSFTAIRIVSQF